jgi:hypothetical protein
MTTRLVVGGLAIAFAAMTLVITLVKATALDRRERGRIFRIAEVHRLINNDSGNCRSIEVLFRVAPFEDVYAAVPVPDCTRYHVSEPVAIMTNPDSPEDAILKRWEPYDVMSPLIWDGILCVWAIALMLTARRWTRRLAAIAGTASESFSMEARAWTSPWGARWISLHALDAGPFDVAVGWIKLMDRHTLTLSPEFPVLVRGWVQAGGVVVARSEAAILWPRGRMRVRRRIPWTFRRLSQPQWKRPAWERRSASGKVNL